MFNEFQQYIIDNNIKEFSSSGEAKDFMLEIEADCPKLYSVIYDEIQNAIDLSDVINSSILSNVQNRIYQVDAAILSTVSSNISSLLKEIEDIRELEEDDTQEHIDCDNAERVRNYS